MRSKHLRFTGLGAGNEAAADSNELKALVSDKHDTEIKELMLEMSYNVTI